MFATTAGAFPNIVTTHFVGAPIRSLIEEPSVRVWSSRTGQLLSRSAVLRLHPTVQLAMMCPRPVAGYQSALVVTQNDTTLLVLDVSAKTAMVVDAVLLSDDEPCTDREASLLLDVF